MNPIALPANIVTVINVVLLALLAVLALIGYLRGFVSQVYDLIMIFLGYLLALLIASPLAKAVPLLPASVNFNKVPFVGAALVAIVDKLIWMLIIIVIVMILGFIFKGLLLRKVLHYQRIVLADRIGGAVFAALPALLAAFVLALVLSVPVFANGSAIIKETVLSPLAPVASGIVLKFITTNPSVQLYQKISAGDKLDTQDFTLIEKTLGDMGFPQNVSTIAMKFVKHEKVTDADIKILKTYAQDNNITPETVTGWLKDFGFTDAQIKDLMTKYK